MDSTTAARMVGVGLLILTGFPQPATTEVLDSDLAAWRSPVAGPTLTEGEYLLLRPVSNQQVDLDGDGQSEQLLVVPYETPSREVAHSVAILRRTSTGYQSNLLLNVFPEELKSVRLIRFGASRTPNVVVYEQGAGSGGFLTLHVYGNRSGRVRSLFYLPGVYQGKYGLLPSDSYPTRLVVTRHLAGEINAYPQGFQRESYRWTDRHFVLTSRRGRYLSHRLSLLAKTPAALRGVRLDRQPARQRSLRTSVRR